MRKMTKKQESIKICQEKMMLFREKVLFLQGETISSRKTI